MTVYNKRREALELTIRLARQEDAPGIIALLIKQHGNYYPNPDFYNLGFVRRSIGAGDLYVALAESEDGLLAGITGANRKNQFAGTLELGMLTVRPACQGFALGKHLHSFLLETLSLQTYSSIFTHCMSLDTISQKICANMGYGITGALLNSYRTDSRAEHFSGLELPVKHNLVVTCRSGDKKDAGDLYAGPYVEYITAVYDSLGVAYRLREEGTAPSGGSSLCTVTQAEKHRYCEVLARCLGPDFENLLGDVLKRYGGLEEQSFNVFINLNDPAAPWACRFLEARGFFFAGLHALSGVYEYMIFHYSPDLPVPFEKIAVLPGFAGEFSYIQGQYEMRR